MLNQKDPTRTPALLVEADRSGDPLTRRLIVAGELDAAGGANLHHSVLDLLRRHRPRRIEIDARGLITLDAAGVAALLLCRSDAGQMECQLTVVHAHHRTRQLLQDAGLTTRPAGQRAGSL